MLPHIAEDVLVFRDVEVTDFWVIPHYAAIDEERLEARNASGSKTGQVYLLMGRRHLHKEVRDTFHIRIRRSGGGKRRVGDCGRREYNGGGG